MFFILLGLGMLIGLIGCFLIQSGMLAVGIILIVVGIIEILIVLVHYYKDGQLDDTCGGAFNDCGPLELLAAFECGSLLTSLDCSGGSIDCNI